MSNRFHKDLTPAEGIHTPHAWEYADATARTSATGFVASDIGKFARQINDNSVWMLLTTTPTWKEVTFSNGVTSVNGQPGPTVNLTTTDVPEGTNLYYTETRVNNNTNVAANSAHRVNTSNPHSVTKSQVGLGNVTDDAQLKRAAGDFNSFTGVAPQLTDVVLVEDASDSFNKKKITISDIATLIGDDLDNVIFVTKVGNDTTGNGTISYPYLTIEKASTIAVAGDHIIVAPGTYTENPFTLADQVSIEGIGRTRVVITAANNNAALITCGSENSIYNLVINGPTNDNAIEIVNKADILINNIEFYAGNTAIDISGASSTNIKLFNLYFEGSISNGLQISGGASVVFDILYFNIPGGRCIFADSSDLLAKNLTVVNSNIAVEAVGSSANVSVTMFSIKNTTTASKLSSSATIRFNNGSAFENVTVPIDADVTSKVIVNNVTANAGDSILQSPTTVEGTVNSEFEGDHSFTVIRELHVGIPELGRESIFGEGESYSRGIYVMTTDNTATSTTDGGNLTDVSAAAKTSSGSTFSFQGTTANHTIIFGSQLADGVDYLKYWGIFSKQTTAAVEVTAKSFVFEIWDGAAWVEIPIMINNANNYYRYGNSAFIRSNLDEQIRFGIDENTTWVKKLINGKFLYWTRIRIVNNLTTAPVFEQFKMFTNSFEINNDGTNTFHGHSRFRQTIVVSGNVFGESGGVVNSNSDVGTGGIPTGWSHDMKNNLMDVDGDAIYLQFPLPRGIDTSMPIIVRVIYEVQPAPTSGSSTDMTIITSFMPLEIQGTIAADPAGGLTPVPRSLANTLSKTAYQAQVSTDSAPATDETKIQSFTTSNFYVDDFYEGDLVAIRVECDDNGSLNKDLVIWGLEISCVKWTHGERI